MTDRPTTTLFLIQSLDGKISTGDNDSRDVDKDLKKITGIKEGLSQYYDLEKTTDWVSFNSGKTQAKIGVNEKVWEGDSQDICFAVVDNQPHLTKSGVEYFARRSAHFFLITKNINHPAIKLQKEFPHLHIFNYMDDVDFADVLTRLKKEFQIEKVTIQTGGNMNAHLLRAGLIDRVSIVVAPCLVGGVNTTSVVDGESLHTEHDLSKIKALKLIKCDILRDSYLHLQYEVINDTKVDNI